MAMPRSRSRGSIHSKRPTSPEVPKRTRTPPFHDDDTAWQQMLNVHEWIMHQEYQKIQHENYRMRMTAKEAYQYLKTSSGIYMSNNSRDWKQTSNDIDMQAKAWQKIEEMRRFAAHEAERTRHPPREAYDQRRQYPQKQEEYKAETARPPNVPKSGKSHRQQKLDIAILWNEYLLKWKNIMESNDLSNSLSFKSIPWPVIVQPSAPDKLIPRDISAFLLSPAHSQDVPGKDRIKDALRRWHPDRFQRWLSIVDDRDKAAVEEGVGIVARCLNELLAQQRKSSSVCREP